MPHMRRQTASRRWKALEPYTDNKAFTGLQDWGLAASWASRRLNRISHKHDADYTNFLHPYTTYNAADEAWIRRSYKDDSYTAAAGQLYFGLKKALLPRSRRDWSTIIKRPRIRPAPRTPSSLKPPTVVHRTTNLVQNMARGPNPRYRLLTARTLGSAYRHGRGVRRWNRDMRRGVRDLRRAGQRSQANFQHLMNCVETKYKDQQSASTQAQPSGAPIDLLDGITGGDDANAQRIGNKIFLRSISLNGEVAASWEALAGACQTVRIMVVQDLMSLGTAPVAADILDLATITTPSRAYRELDKAMRFKILYERKVDVTKPITDLAQGQSCKRFRFHKSWPKGLHVRYDSSAGATANIQRNNIWVFCFADETTVNENPTVSFSSRIRYTD